MADKISLDYSKRNARIYNESKVCTQSGSAKSDNFILEFSTPEARYKEPLMGWTGSKDTLEQVRISFESLEDAVFFAKKHNIYYEVTIGNKSKFIIKHYADNFK